MDALTIVGGIAASVQLLAGLQKTVINVIDLYRGVRDIHESTSALGDQLEALQSVLFLLTNEARRVAPGSDASMESDGNMALSNVLTNAGKTFARLEEILKNITRERRLAEPIRQYICKRSYDSTLRDLRERLIMYVQILYLALTMMSSAHSRQSEDARMVFVKVVANRIDLMQESQLRLGSHLSTSAATPPTPPTSIPDKIHALIETNPSQAERTLNVPQMTVDSCHSHDSTFVQESFELINLSQTMASSIRAMCSTMGSSDAPPIRAELLSETGQWGISDTLSLYPIVSNHLLENVSRYVDEHNNHVEEGVISIDQIVDHDDGVPTELDRQVFDVVLMEARNHTERSEYAQALVPLEILLAMARTYTFVEDETEREITNLVAAALVNSASSPELRDRFIRLHPSVVHEVVLAGLAKAKKLASSGELDEAIQDLESLHECPAAYPDSQIVLPDEAALILASCLVKTDMARDRATAIATRYPAVDYHLTKIRSDAVLAQESSLWPIAYGLRHVGVSRRVEEDTIKEIISAIRCAIDGWKRLQILRLHDIEAEETEQRLLLSLANLLEELESDGDENEGEEILLQLINDRHLNIQVHAKAEFLLAALYIKRFSHWESARQHAKSAARLYSKCRTSGDEYTLSVELYVRTCELLGDPMAVYAAKTLPPGWKRSLVPTSFAFSALSRHFVKTRALEPEKALSMFVDFLETNYRGTVVDPLVQGADTCWDCLKSSIRKNNAGHLSSTDRCQQGRCPDEARHPLLEYLASSKPIVDLPDDAEDYLETSLEIYFILQDIGASKQDPGWLPVNIERTLRLAVASGNHWVVRFIFDETDILGYTSPNQIDAIRDGTTDLAGLIPGARYEDVTTRPRRQRSTGEMEAIGVLTRRISTQGVVALLRRCFLPDSVWDVEVLRLILSRHRRALLVRDADGKTISGCILRNAIKFLSGETGQGLKLDVGLAIDMTEALIYSQDRAFRGTPEQAAWDKNLEDLFEEIKALPTNQLEQISEFWNWLTGRNKSGPKVEVQTTKGIQTPKEMQPALSKIQSPPIRNKRKFKRIWLLK